jgi:hypothetical protein
MDILEEEYGSMYWMIERIFEKLELEMYLKGVDCEEILSRAQKRVDALQGSE